MKSFSASNLLNYFSYDDDLLRRIMLLILLLMPIFILIGRSPLDIAASTIAVSFLIHSIYWKDFRWLRAKWVQATLLFWLFTVFNSLQAHDVNHALSRSIPFVRFPIFAIAVSYWVLKTEEDLKFFIYVFMVAILFSTIDGLFEFLFGYDFSGRKALPGRLSGPFEVSTLGIYLTKLGLPMLIAFYAIAPKKSELTKYLFLITGFLLLFNIIFSGERMALLLTLFSLFLCTWMVKKYRIYLMTTLTVSLIAFSSFVFFNENFYNRIYVSTVGELQSDPKKTVASYKGQIDAAIAIIRDNPLFGVGPDNYRYVCKLKKYDPLATDSFSRCLIHPHHVYLETWVSNGLIGIILFCLIIYYWLKLFIQHRPDKTKNTLLLSGTLGLLLFLWPFSVGMSIYANFNGIWFWMMVGFFLTTYQLQFRDIYSHKNKILFSS